MKTLKYIFMGAIAGVLCAVLFVCAHTAREALFLKGLPEIYEYKYDGGFVKIFGLTMADGGKCICIIQMLERGYSNENRPRHALRLNKKANEKYGFTSQMRWMPTLGEYGKYYFTCHYGNPGKKGHIVLDAEDFEYIPSAPEWDKLDNASFPTPIPATRGTYDMPSLEKSGFPIIVK